MACFSQSLSRWLALRCLNVRPRTVEFYTDCAAIITRSWQWPDISPDQITENQLLEFAALVAHECPSRWNTMVAALRSITPAARVIPKRPLRVRDFRPPSQQEFARLVHECDSLPRTKAGLVVRFLANTGLRIGEARALTWGNVFADRIEVPAFSTKGGKKGRSVPLTAGAREVLERLRALGGEFVLPRQNPRKAIEKACRLAGIPRLSVHCLRHLFTTRCVEAGVDLPTVARWLGHSDGGALLSKTYFHLVDAHSREMAAKVQI